MNEWKELKINNLPPDILTGDYEWEWTNNSWTRCTWNSLAIISEVLKRPDNQKFRYRKPEPKTPTHEEIMTKWWKLTHAWFQVKSYHIRDHEYYIMDDTNKDNDSYGWQSKDWFIGRESATIPPE